MSSNVEQIKEQLSITDVVSSYVKLEKAGSNYKAKCPFHNEKTPSFFVSPSRGSYYCFGCNAKGDIFSFVEQFEGLDFVGALKVLAARAGVELVRENPQARSEKDRLYAVLEVATEFFEKSLAQNAGAKNYLAKRGVKEETIKQWRLGFAQNEWRALHDELLKKGFKPDEMIRAGLIKKSDRQDGGYYDFFRGRLMFPIFDSSDRVIAFSGRIMPELDDGKTGKYVNSPETILFNKSRVLYGLSNAKFDIRKRDYSIMVEGQMDLIMSHQAGFTNTVAVSGTALSADIVSEDAVTNLGLLTRLSNNVILAFDSDEAGFKASARNAKIALSIGMDVKVAKMPKSNDPADIILRSPEEWKHIIKDSKHVIDFTLETLLERNLDARKLGKEIQILVLPYVASLKSAIDQAHFVSKIATVVSIKEDALWTELKKVKAPLPATDAASPKVSPVSKPDRRNAIERKILGIIFWQEKKEKPEIGLADFLKDFQNVVGNERFDELLKSQNKSELIFEAELSYQGSGNLSRETAELLLNLEEEAVGEKLEEAMKELYGANRDKRRGDQKQLGELIQKLSVKKQELQRRRNIDK